MKPEIEEALKKFLNSFEEVFDKDWKYSKAMMGIIDETEEDKKRDKEFGLESIDIIADDGTFLNPKVDDETEDWRNRGALLQEYRELKKLLENID